MAGIKKLHHKWFLLFLLTTTFLLNGCGVCKKKESLLDIYKKAKHMFFTEGDTWGAFEELIKIGEKCPNFPGRYFNFMLGYCYEERNIYHKAIDHYLKELKFNLQETEKDKEIYSLTLSYLGDTYYKSGWLYRYLFRIAVNIHLNYYNSKYLISKIKSNLQEEVDFPTDCQTSKYFPFFYGISCIYAREYSKAHQILKDISKDSVYWSLAEIFQKNLKKDIGKLKDPGDPLFREKLSEEIISTILPDLKILSFTEKDKVIQAIDKSSIPEPLKRQIKLSLADISIKKKDLRLAEEILSDLDLSAPEIIERLKGFKTKDATLIEYEVKYWDPFGLYLKSNLCFKKAIEFYEKFLSLLAPKVSRELCQIGICYFALGYNDLAEKIFKKIMDASESMPEIRLKALVFNFLLEYLKQTYTKASIPIERICEEIEDPYALSDLGRLLARIGKDYRSINRLCNQEGNDRPGTLSSDTGVFYLEYGLHTAQAEKLNLALNFLEKNHIQESGYSIKQNDPRLLLDLFSAFYYKKFYNEATNIIKYFINEYPETIQILHYTQATQEAWSILKWQKDQPFKPIWRKVCICY